MTHTPHELAEEFPSQGERIRKLKAEDAHFAKLANAYHELNREIHRVETRIETASEEREEILRKKRVALKDEIAAILAKAS